MEEFEAWLSSKKLTIQDNILALQNNLQVHRSKLSMKFMEKSKLNYWFLPTYSPEYAPVVKAFAFLKENGENIDQKSI